MGNFTIENVTVSYEKTEIIHQLSFEINKGKITTLIGPNGCGKSTMIKAIARLLPIKAGTIVLDGQKIQQYPTKELAKELAILPQSSTTPEGISVSELVSYGRFPYQKGFGSLTAEDKAKITWAIEETNLTEFAEQEVDKLSGGQKQRAFIAMALAQDTDILILDEPTTYLDMAHQLEILLLLQKLNQEEGRTILMALHDLNHAARFSDTMLAMKSGQLIALGSPQEMMTKEILAQTFEIDAEILLAPNKEYPICLSYELLEKE